MEPTRIELKGGAQKGPFVLGSSVTVAVIDEDANPVGATFPTQTVDDEGRFALELEGEAAVQIEATGFYYNEVTGQLSGSPITLRAYDEVGGGAEGMHTIGFGVGEFDGDGNLDVVVRSQLPMHPMYLLRGDGAGGFATAELLDGVLGGAPTVFAVADMDGDGLTDIVTGDGTGPTTELFVYTAGGW